ncbi:MAG: phage tail tape measure protein, partial [Deltaproteobacteria bacterium]|nr:phage tail tape measure protein [Deltaproteobacteria bacterium]
MQNRVGKFTRSMSRGFYKLNRVVNKFGRSLKRGAQIGAFGLAMIGGAMHNVLGAGADFEQAITNVGAVGLQTRAQIAPLERQALQLGRTTKFTATQAANAMEILAKAGFNTQQILETTPAVLSAAAASGLDIAEVAEHVSKVLKGMGLEMDQSARVADVLALASARTNSTIGSLGESMKNAAATARKLGVPLEDAVASIALLQDV